MIVCGAETLHTGVVPAALMAVVLVQKGAVAVDALVDPRNQFDRRLRPLYGLGLMWAIAATFGTVTRLSTAVPDKPLWISLVIVFCIDTPATTFVQVPPHPTVITRL